MAFVNERITGNDRERYNIPEIERRIVVSDYITPSACTIDHERGIYLLDPAEEREMRPGSDNRWPTGLYGWVFLWHGHELWVEAKWLARGGESTGHGWGHLRLMSLGLMGEKVGMLGKARRLPPELMPHREEILKDLYEALLVYRVSGIFSKYTSFDLNLELAEGI
ncbi:MAG: hypothetical protein LBD68_02255 [Zoogloeaceae bacterium]|nr:hypothetical protein [Zoogloeaceae bacterium]